MQAQALPHVVDKLHGMMEQMERHSQQLGERLLASQESHHREARVIYAELAASVDASLKHSLMESARIAGDTIRPAVETTMSGIAQETATLYQKLASTVEAQLDGVSARFDRSVSAVSETWTCALARHEQTGDALNSELKQTLTAHTDTFERQSASLLATVERTHGALQADLASVTRTLVDETKTLHAGLTQATQSQLEELSSRFERTATEASASWSEALGRHEQSSISMGRETQAALAATVGHFEQTSASLLASVGASHAALQEASAAQDQQRLDALTEAVESMASSLQKGVASCGRAGPQSSARVVRCAGRECTADWGHDRGSGDPNHRRSCTPDADRVRGTQGGGRGDCPAASGAFRQHGARQHDAPGALSHHGDAGYPAGCHHARFHRSAAGY
jgi:hypothetical protein